MGLFFVLRTDLKGSFVCLEEIAVEMMRHGAIPLLALFTVSAGWRQEQKLPIPSAADQKSAEQQIKSIYSFEYRARDANAKKALAFKLLKDANTSEDPERFVLLRESWRIASDSSDVETAFSAADALARIYQMGLTGATMTLADMKLDVLAKARRAAISNEDVQVAANLYLLVAGEALTQGDFDAAQRACTGGEQTARAAREDALAIRAAALSKDIQELKRQSEQARRAELALSVNDADAASNVVYGKYLVFVRHEAERGFQCLAKGADAALQELAKKELSKSGGEAQVELGDAWWEYAEKAKTGLEKRRYQARSRHWYETALQGGVFGLVRTKAEKRLDEVKLALAGPPVDLLKLIEPKRHQVFGQWSFSGQTLVSPSSLLGQMLITQIEIPFKPSEEYNVRLMVERKDERGDLYIGLYGTSQFSVNLDCEGASGLDLLDGKRSGGNESSWKGVVFGKKAVTILCAVRKTGVAVEVDGKRIIDWKGDLSRLSLNRSPFRLPRFESMFVAANGVFHVSEMTLVPVSGEGKKLR